MQLQLASNVRARTPKPNFKELENACPHRSSIPKSRHFVKDKTCPVCIEESGSRVAHWRKKGDRQPGVMHLDLASRSSADVHKYCLVAAVTSEVEKESKLLPIFAPMPKKDAVSGLAATKEALALRNDRNLHQITGSRITRIQADGGGSIIRRSRTCALTRTLPFPSHLLISHLNLERPRWSYACGFAGHITREKVLRRTCHGHCSPNWLEDGLGDRHMAEWHNENHARWHCGQGLITDAIGCAMVSRQPEERPDRPSEGDAL